MPPWAQTEWERFTGTTETRSTACPASAIRIAAARPARPPPTIAILIPSLAISLKNSSQQTTRANEGNRGVNADQQEHNSKRDAGITGQSLRAFANRDAPVDHEQ